MYWDIPPYFSSPRREPRREPGREPRREPHGGLHREPRREPGREPHGGLHREPRREPGREPRREPGRESRREPYHERGWQDRSGGLSGRQLIARKHGSKTAPFNPMSGNPMSGNRMSRDAMAGNPMTYLGPPTQKRRHPARVACLMAVIGFVIGGFAYADFIHSKQIVMDIAADMEAAKPPTDTRSAIAHPNINHPNIARLNIAGPNIVKVAGQLRRLDSIDGIYWRWISRWQGEDRNFLTITATLEKKLAEHVAKHARHRVHMDLQHLQTYVFTANPRSKDEISSFLQGFEKKMIDFDRRIAAYRHRMMDAPAASYRARSGFIRAMFDGLTPKYGPEYRGEYGPEYGGVLATRGDAPLGHGSPPNDSLGHGSPNDSRGHGSGADHADIAFIPAPLWQRIGFIRHLAAQDMDFLSPDDAVVDRIGHKVAQIIGRRIATYYRDDPLLQYIDTIGEHAVALGADNSAANLAKLYRSLGDLADFRGEYARLAAFDGHVDREISALFQSMSASLWFADAITGSLAGQLDSLALNHRDHLTRNVHLLGPIIHHHGDGAWNIAPRLRSRLQALQRLFDSPLMQHNGENSVDRLRELTAFNRRIDWNMPLLQGIFDGYADVRAVDGIAGSDAGRQGAPIPIDEAFDTIIRQIAVRAFFDRALTRIVASVRPVSGVSNGISGGIPGSIPGGVSAGIPGSISGGIPGSISRGSTSLISDKNRGIADIFSRLFALRDVHNAVSFPGYDILQWAVLTWSYHQLEDLTDRLQSSDVFVWKNPINRQSSVRQAAFSQEPPVQGWLKKEKRTLAEWIDAAAPLVDFTGRYRPRDHSRVLSFWKSLIEWNDGRKNDGDPAIFDDADRYYALTAGFFAHRDPCFSAPSAQETKQGAERDNFFALRLGQMQERLDRHCLHQRRHSPVPVVYNSLVDAFQLRLSGRYPFADPLSDKDVESDQLRDFFTRFHEKAPTIKAFLQKQTGDSPDRQAALHFIDRIQSSRVFLQPFLASDKHSIRVDLDIGSGGVPDRRQGAPDRIEIIVGKKHFPLKKKQSFLWKRGDRIAIRMIWEADSPFMPVVENHHSPGIGGQDRGPDGQGGHKDIVIEARGEWSLLRLIEHYSTGRKGDAGWVLGIPATLIKRADSDNAFPRPYDLQFSMLLNVTVGRKGHPWHQVSSLPNFPRQIRKISPALLR